MKSLSIFLLLILIISGSANDLFEMRKNNKEKIESFFKIPIKNYNLINKAVSNFNGSSDFYISEYDLCSSLLKYKI